MKTTKLIVITAIMFFASVGFSFTESSTANHGENPTNVLIKISLQKAIHLPALRMEIYNQISPRFLKEPASRDYYSFRVSVHQQHYIVYGSYNDWKKFFYQTLIIKK